jgi:hypothetical protein
MSELNLNITEQQLPVITFNFEEMKEALRIRLAEYKGLIVTDENLSICKAQQKDLAGMRIKIDTYRKDTKKEMSKPIVEFEDKCNQLVKLVEEAEKPLKEGIQVFDDKKRDEKRKHAEGIIQATIEQHGLTEKYAKQLTVLDKYTLLGAKASEVRDDVEQRVFILLGEQSKEKEMLEIIQDAIDNANKTIKKQVDISSIQWMINRGMSTREIIQSINSLAKQIWEAENPAPAPEPVVEPITETYMWKAGATPEAPKAAEPVKDDEPLYYVELRFVSTFDGIGKLSALLKANDIEYTVVKKGKVD